MGAGVRLGTWIFIALLCFSASPACAGDWEDALAAHDAGRYEEALALLEPLAEAGNLDAQNKLSHMYWYGEGTEPDYAKALNWSQTAAAAGSASAMYDIGVHYRTGLGVDQSDEEAFGWFLKSAEAGGSHGARNVALSYFLAIGVEADLAKFYHWQDIAVERGDKTMQLLAAETRLAAGLRDEADRLLQSAAAQNLADAQFRLGELFLEGESGWPKDAAQAYVWMTIAAASGCLEAPTIIKRIAEGMSAAQLSEAAALAEMWQEAHPIEPGQVHPVKRTACRAAPSVSG